MWTTTVAAAATSALKPFRQLARHKSVCTMARPSGRSLIYTETKVTQPGAAVRPPAEKNAKTNATQQGAAVRPPADIH